MSKIYVIPVNDLQHHHESDTCPCNPVVDGDLVIHNAFDGRDINEIRTENETTEKVN